MLFDSHAHAHFNAYKNDSDEVIQRALDKGVQMVLVGTQIDTSRKAIVTAEKYDGVWASVGLHPIHLEEGYFDLNEDPTPLVDASSAGHGPTPEGINTAGFRRRAEVFDKEKYRGLALSSKKVVAIGETGLDYYRLEGDEARQEAVKEKQRQIFKEQAELAAELDLALIVHCRDGSTPLTTTMSPLNGAHGEVLEILKLVKSKYRTLRGVIHCFTGTPEEGERYLDFGFYISFPGIITFSKNWDEFIKSIPVDKILVETDCPYLTPVPYRGQRNEPAYVKYTARRLADIKGLTFEEIALVTAKNAGKIFSIKII